MFNFILAVLQAWAPVAVVAFAVLLIVFGEIWRRRRGR